MEISEAIIFNFSESMDPLSENNYILSAKQMARPD